MEPSNGSIWSGRRSVDALRVRPPQKNIHSNSCARQVTIHDRKVFLAPFACTDHDIHFRCFSRSCHGLSANAVATRGACLPSWPLRPRLVVFLRARVGPFLAPSWRGRWLRWLAGGGKPPSQPANHQTALGWRRAKNQPSQPASAENKGSPGTWGPPWLALWRAKISGVFRVRWLALAFQDLLAMFSPSFVSRQRRAFMVTSLSRLSAPSAA